jgi:hypothetical protein
MIDISNHPVKTNITRKVEYGGLLEINKEWYSSPKQVTIVFKVFYFLNGEPLFEKDVSHIVYLRAMETTFVDQEGNIVPEEEGIMSEFDYFQIVKDNPIKINNLIYAKAMQGDQEGRFDFDI